MNILQVSSHYVPAYGFGGPLQVAHALGREWVKAGHEVTVCCTNMETPESDLDVPTDVPVPLDGVQVWYEPVTLSRHYGYSPRMYSRLKSLTADADLVVVHAHYQFAQWAGARIARKLGKPYVIFAHGSLRKEGIRHKSALIKLAYLAVMERKNLSGAVRVVFNGADELEGSLWSHRGVVMRNSIDPAQLDASGEDAERLFPAIAGKIRFLFLGRLDVKHKGLDFLLESFSAATRQRDDVALILAGPDERGDREVLRDLIARFGLERSVVFTGVVSGAVKAAVLRSADVFVLPSRFEGGSPISALEGLYVGLPIILTPGIGLSDEVVANRLGMVAKPGDELTQAIVAMLDPAVRAAYAGRGRPFVLENFVWKKTAAGLLDEITALLHGRRESMAGAIG
jgi:glycosyltransferase involved in cell wall biosynthesis